MITHRSCGDSDGKGWPVSSTGKVFASETPIKDVWDWYMEESLGGPGLLEMVGLEDTP